MAELLALMLTISAWWIGVFAILSALYWWKTRTWASTLLFSGFAMMALGPLVVLIFAFIPERYHIPIYDVAYPLEIFIQRAMHAFGLTVVGLAFSIIVYQVTRKKPSSNKTMEPTR